MRAPGQIRAPQFRTKLTAINFALKQVDKLKYGHST